MKTTLLALMLVLAGTGLATVATAASDAGAVESSEVIVVCSEYLTGMMNCSHTACVWKVGMGGGYACIN